MDAAPRMPDRLTVTTTDGVSSELGVFRPAYWPRALVVCLPALGVAAGYYQPFAEALAERRILAVTGEFRGNGTSSVEVRRGVDFGYAELVEYDIAAIVSRARELLETSIDPVARSDVSPDLARRMRRPVLIAGHSLGGQLGAIYAGKTPGALDGIVLIGACTPYHRAYRASLAPLLLGGSRLAAVFSRKRGVFPGRYFRFGTTEAPTLIADWATTVRTGRYDVAGAHTDYERALAAVDIPVLALSIDGDRYAPRRTVDHLVEKLSAARVTRRHLDGRDLEGPALDHFRWARNPAGMVSVIEGWLGVQGF